MSFLNQPSGLPLAPLLNNLYSVLSTDATLISLVDVASIGGNVRKSLKYPAVEFGVESGSHQADVKDTQRLSLMIYGTNSLEETVTVADRVKELMTPKLLTDKPNGVYVASVRLIRNVVLPSDDYGHTVSMSFSLKYARV